MSRDLQTEVFSILKSLQGLEPLKQLFWQRLNYDRVNQPLPRQDWAESARQALAEDPILFANANDFHILYCRLAADCLRLTDERAVVNRLLREHPYALFIFSDQRQTRWHFVNVKEGARKPEVEERKVRRLLRRIAVGPEERLRTAAERVSMLDVATIPPTLFGVSPLEIQQRHDEAFDVEAVTRKFFRGDPRTGERGYVHVFEELQKRLCQQTNDPVWAHDYALQFLNRLMFLYFIQRKRWLGDNPDFMCTFWEAYKDSGQPNDTFFERWLSVLFFEAFNEKFQAGRTDRRHFPPEIRDALALAPYLNGGLFTRNDLDRKFPFTVPDAVFNMLFDRFNDQTPGFLEHYNFTISEDTPFDQEVAVDPEMIGKVYESLVNITFEGIEEEDLRGTAGIFYTPRVEIDLMCRLSLADWLANRLGEQHKPLLYEAVFAYDPDEKDDADDAVAWENLWPELNGLLREVTVLDPACGSGSFLVGMLAVLDDLQARANAQLGDDETLYERRKRIIGQSLYGVDVMPWAVHVAELRLWLQLVVETPLQPAELKFRPLLPNLSFKVRPGDSLVQEVGGINLALHQSSRLIPSTLKGRITKLKGEKLKFYNNDPERRYLTAEQLQQAELELFHDILDTRAKAIDERLKEIADALRPQVNLFGEIQDTQMRLDRVTLERERDDLQTEREQVARSRQALTTAGSVPFVWDIAFVEIFEGDKGGFDLVLGNPPYVYQEQIAPPGQREQGWPPDEWRDLKRAYKDKLQHSVAVAYPRFSSYKPTSGKFRKLDGKSDLYIYFYLHGLSLLNEQGSFCFITSNSWLDVGYGRDLQEFLLRHGHVKMILDNEARRTFAQADVNTIIALLGPPDDRRPAGLDKTARFVMFKVPFEEVLSPVVFQEIEEATERFVRPEFRVITHQQRDLFEEGLVVPEDEVRRAAARYEGNKWGGKYLRAPEIFFTIMEKGKGKLVRMKDIAEVQRGFTTGANDFFYVRVIGEEAPGVVRVVCDDGSEHLLEAEYVCEPVMVKAREIVRPAMSAADLRYCLVRLDEAAARKRHTNAYITWGETQGFHNRPTTRGRRPWYAIRVQDYAAIAFPLAHKRRPVLALLQDKFHLDKRLCAIYPHHSDDALLIAASLLGTFSTLGREVYGRANFGQGLLELAVYEVANLEVLAPGCLTAKDKAALTAAFYQLAERDILMLYDDVRCADRVALDDAFLEAVGFTDAVERSTLVKELHDAACRMIWKRMAKTGNARESWQSYDEWLATGQPFGLDVEEK